MTTEHRPAGSRDRVSDPADEQENAEAVLKLLDEMVALHDEMNHWPATEPGSVLFNNDETTRPFPTSFEARYLLLVAADNLIGLRNMLIESGEGGALTMNLFPFAPYTLLRNAIECAGTALWLIEPTERHQRVLRTAQFALEDAKKNRAALTAMGGNGDTTFDRKKGFIEKMIEPFAELSWKNVNDGFSVTGMLTVVGALPQLEGLNPLGKWQIASGMAHGKRWAGLLLSDLREASKPEPNGDSILHVYGNFKSLLWLVSCASTLLVEASSQVLDMSRKPEVGVE